MKGFERQGAGGAAPNYYGNYNTNYNTNYGGGYNNGGGSSNGGGNNYGGGNYNDGNYNGGHNGRGGIEERVLTTKRLGMPMLLLIIFLYILGVLSLIASVALGTSGAVIGVLILCFATFLVPGLKVLQPQEAFVLTLFGKYKGTLRGPGFFFVNPFCTAVNPAANTKLGQSGDVEEQQSFFSRANGKNRENTQTVTASRKISLKAMTLSNSRQKVNDVLGNPVEVGVAVIWRVTDTAKAVFQVDNYKEYLSLQVDTAVRDIVKIYPYDVAQNVDTTGDGQADDGSLRGSTTVVAERIRAMIQSKVEFAGIEVIEARITYLAYAPEIASAMLQRQQAAAIIDARKMIVEGSVSMVEMALERLDQNQIVDLDDERKAAMVSNLLVILCGSRDAQPVINAGSLY